MQGCSYCAGEGAIGKGTPDDPREMCHVCRERPTEPDLVTINVGDRVVFSEPGFPLTGQRGKVEGARPFALLVAFDNGSVGTWRRAYFLKEQPS